MLKIIIALFFFSISSFAQNAFFIDKKGKKTIMRDDTVEIIVIDERISYSEVGKEWEKYIRFKDLDYAIVGPYFFKSFILINEKGKTTKENAYFVMTENATKKLLVNTYTVVSKYGSTDYHFIYVIDNYNNILDSEIKFTRASQQLDKRKNAENMIRKHFSDNTELIERLNASIENDTESLGILTFLYFFIMVSQLEYLSCFQI